MAKLQDGTEIHFSHQVTLISAAFHKSRTTDESQAFSWTPAFQEFLHPPDETPTPGWKRKRKACMTLAYFNNEAMPPSCSAGWGSSLAGTAHPQGLCSPRARSVSTGILSHEWGTSAEDARTVFTHHTHEENWEGGWSQKGTKDCYLSRSLDCATQSPTLSSSGLKWEISAVLYRVVWVF